MKTVASLALGLIHMAGCSVGTPSVSEVAAIEAMTAQSRCVGSLDRWHREFTFEKRGNRISRDMISVTYTEAGHRGLPAGRFVGEPPRSPMIDDAQFRGAWGQYDRRAGKFVEWDCGCNFPVDDTDGEIDCPTVEDEPRHAP